MIGSVALFILSGRISFVPHRVPTEREKSKLFLSPKARSGHARSISAALGIGLTSNLGQSLALDPWACYEGYVR